MWLPNMSVLAAPIFKKPANSEFKMKTFLASGIGLEVDIVFGQELVCFHYLSNTDLILWPDSCKELIKLTNFSLAAKISEKIYQLFQDLLVSIEPLFKNIMQELFFLMHKPFANLYLMFNNLTWKATEKEYLLMVKFLIINVELLTLENQEPMDNIVSTS